MKYHISLCLSTLLVVSACTPQPGQSQDASTASTANAGAIGPTTLNVADAAIAGGDPSMALSVSQSVLTTDPSNADALIHEGDAYYALNRCPAAEAAYTLAIKSDSKSTAAETGMGRCLMKTDPKAAEAALLMAVQDDPGNAAAFNDLGVARDLQGNFAGAVDPYQKALLADPAMTAAEVNLGLSLALSGNGAQALQYLGPLATGPDATPKIRQDYAAALVAAGRVSEARAVLSVDLPPDQVNNALDGFSAVIAGAQPPLPQGVASAPPTTPQIATASVAASPLPQAAAAPQPVASAMPQPLSTPSGPYLVQLGALPSPSEALNAWHKISFSLPDLFAGKQPVIEPASINGKTFYRLRTGDFSTQADASKFCGEVTAAGNTCTVADF